VGDHQLGPPADNLRRLVRRILNRYGYPPDKQPKAVQIVLEQAELLARDWAA
jgi:type I restriction enzyme R subunit